MAVVTDRKKGLFPLPGEITFGCNCPDWAVMCKHVAAVLYGTGARLDQRPEMLFDLRGVNHEELIDSDVDIAVATTGEKAVHLATDDLSRIFDIDIPSDDAERQRSRSDKLKPPKKKAAARRKVRKSAAKSTKKSAVKKRVGKAAKKSTKKKSVEKKSTRRGVTEKKPSAKRTPRKKKTKKAPRP